MPEDAKVGLLMLTAVVPKIAVSCSQSILFACTIEIVKPEQRQNLVLSCLLSGRICLLAAPYIGYLMDVHQLLPLSIFGVFGVLGGIATCLISTPRTYGNECPEKVLPDACTTGKVYTID